ILEPGHCVANRFLRSTSERNGARMKTNYVAVAVCGVVYWLLGGLWFGVLFSKPWRGLEHVTEEQARSMNPVLPYVVSFLLNLVIAYALAQLCLWRNGRTGGGGGCLGGLVGI